MQTEEKNNETKRHEGKEEIVYESVFIDLKRNIS